MYDGGDTSELQDLHMNQSSAPDLTMNQSSALTSQLAQYDLMSDTNMDQLNLQIEKERSVGRARAPGHRWKTVAGRGRGLSWTWFALCLYVD